MKCPLLMPRWIGMPELIKEAQVECVKEECAWWGRDEAECLFQSIDTRLGDIAHWLREIADKMPHEGQFRR